MKKRFLTISYWSMVLKEATRGHCDGNMGSWAKLQAFHFGLIWCGSGRVTKWPMAQVTIWVSPSKYPRRTPWAFTAFARSRATEGFSATIKIRWRFSLISNPKLKSCEIIRNHTENVVHWEVKSDFIEAWRFKWQVEYSSTTSIAYSLTWVQLGELIFDDEK